MFESILWKQTEKDWLLRWQNESERWRGRLVAQIRKLPNRFCEIIVSTLVTATFYWEYFKRQNLHFQILNHDFPSVLKTTMYIDKNFATLNTPAVPPSWTDKQGESLNENQWRRCVSALNNMIARMWISNVCNYIIQCLEN